MADQRRKQSFWSEPAARTVEIRSLELATGRQHPILPIAGSIFPGLSVSPDRKSFIYSWSAVSGTDRMLLENFK